MNLCGMNWSILLCLVIIIREIQMANILVLLPLPLHSHTINFIPIVKALAARGHNITMISPFPQTEPIPNFTDIHVKLNMSDFVRHMPINELTKVNERMFQLFGIWRFTDTLGELALNNEAVLKLIKDKDSKFDLVMIETFLFQEALVAFGYKFNAPVINLHPGILPASAAYYTGNQIQLSYTPTRFSSFSDHMTFLQRVESTFFHTWELLMSRLYVVRLQDNLMRKYLQHPELPNLPPLIDMLKNTSLTLINHNSAFGYPHPLHKNVIEFGGANIKYAEKLPKELQHIMDNATEGVIFFSFGTFVNISDLPQTLQQSMLSAFGKVKQRVLVKWDKSTIVSNELPKNIEFRTWFPQSSILGHPNCKLFITHGGLHSLMESIYHGIPILAIPLFADQKYNAKFVEINSLGKALRLRKINEEKLLNSINSVLHNPMYKENILERSAIFKDNPINILDNAIYWVEYVIRHKGAPHLRPAVLDLYWFQDLMLDVIVMYLIIIVLFLFIIKTILCLLYKSIRWLVCGKKSLKKDQKKVKKN